MFANSPPLQVIYSPPQTSHVLQQSETASTPFSPMSISNDNEVNATNSNRNFPSTMHYHHVPIHRALPETPPNARSDAHIDDNNQNIVTMTAVNPSQNMDKFRRNNGNHHNDSYISPSILSVSTFSIPSSLNISSPTEVDDKKDEVLTRTVPNNNADGIVLQIADKITINNDEFDGNNNNNTKHKQRDTKQRNISYTSSDINPLQNMDKIARNNDNHYNDSYVSPSIFSVLTRTVSNDNADGIALQIANKIAINTESDDNNTNKHKKQNTKQRNINPSQSMDKIARNNGNHHNDSYISPSILSVSTLSIPSSLNISSPTDDDDKKHDVITGTVPNDNADKATIINTEYDGNNTNKDKKQNAKQRNMSYTSSDINPLQSMDKIAKNNDNHHNDSYISPSILSVSTFSIPSSLNISCPTDDDNNNNNNNKDDVLRRTVSNDNSNEIALQITDKATIINIESDGNNNNIKHKKRNTKHSNISCTSSLDSYRSLLSPSTETKHHRNSINIYSSISGMLALEKEKEEKEDRMDNIENKQQYKKQRDNNNNKGNLSSMSCSFSSASYSSSSSPLCMILSSNNNLQKMEKKEEEKEEEDTELTLINKLNEKTENGVTLELESKFIENMDKIDNYIYNDILKRKIGIYFDKYCIKKEDNYYFNKHSLLSSKGLISGYYEWLIEIIKCEGSAQEMGIVSNPDIDNINIKQNEGIIETQQFGARAIYGNRLESVYYASYNDNNKQRCYKNLSDKNKICWSKGDIIKICLDLNKYRIKFFLNNKKVRKKISIQPNKTYYPIISFVGDFKYKIKL